MNHACDFLLLSFQLKADFLTGNVMQGHSIFCLILSDIMIELPPVGGLFGGCGSHFIRGYSGWEHEFFSFGPGDF